MANNMQTDDQPEQAKPKCKRARWCWISIFILIIALVGLGYALYTNTFNIKKWLVSEPDQAPMIQLQKDVDTLEKQVLQLTEDLKSQQQIINALRQTQTGYSRDDWRIVESEYLVKLANDKLQFENNVPQAITLLQMADQQLRDMNNDKVLVLRKALADDIASLQALPQLDVAGIYMRLSALNEQISKLPLPNKPTDTADLQTENMDNLPWWKRGLQQTWVALQKIVVVRYSKDGSLPLVMPEQQDFLYQNLHAAIEKAMWALLHQQPDIYRASLEQAATWINQYFQSDSPATTSVLASLAELEKMDVRPVAPKISGAMQAFSDFFVSVGTPAEKPAVPNQ